MQIRYGTGEVHEDKVQCAPPYSYHQIKGVKPVLLYLVVCDDGCTSRAGEVGHILPPHVHR
jgi:hypothetical protein